MRASGATSGSRNATVASPRATTRSTISFTRSARACSAMATHASAQVLQRAELKLLDGALGPIERRGHVANALLVDETHADHLPLQIRQLFHMSIERDPPLDLLEFAGVRQVGRRIVRVARTIAPIIGNRIRSDSKQPRGRRHAAPFELSNRAQRLLEHL